MKVSVRVVLVSILLLFLAARAGPVSQTQSAPEPDYTRSTSSFEAFSYYVEGMTHFSRQEHEEAQKAMQRALEYDPNYIPALKALLSQSGVSAGVVVQAGERLLSLLPVTEENARRICLTYRRLSDILEGQTEKQIGVLRQAVSSGLAERYARHLRSSLVWALSQSDRKREAFDIFEDQIASYPSGSPAAFIAALEEAEMLRRLGAEKAARALIAQQLVGDQLDQNALAGAADTTIVNEIAERALYTGQTEQLREWLEAILRKVPDRCQPAFDAQKALGALFEKQERWREAAEAYEEAVARASPEGWALRDLMPVLLKAADIYRERLGKIEQAANIYTKVLTGPYLPASLYPLANETEERLRKVLKEMGKPVPPEHPGQKEKSVFVWGNFEDLFPSLSGAGYSFVRLRHPRYLLEHLCSAEVVHIPGFGQSRAPWDQVQNLADYVFRGGGLFVCSVTPGRDVASLARQLGFEVRHWVGIDEEPMRAIQEGSLAKAGEGLKVTPQAALVCPPSWIILEAGGVPVLAAREYGLGRVAVSTGHAWDFAHSPWPEVEEVQVESDRFYVSLFDWLRGGGERDPDLKRAFRSAQDAIARREYRGAIEALDAICGQYPDGAWEEQAGYLKAQLLEQKLEDFQAAQEEYETVFRRFPAGDLALPSLMGRAACLEKRRVSWEKAREQYRQVADMAPDTEIGAAARVHEAALALRHEGANQAP